MPTDPTTTGFVVNVPADADMATDGVFLLPPFPDGVTYPVQLYAAATSGPDTLAMGAAHVASVGSTPIEVPIAPQISDCLAPAPSCVDATAPVGTFGMGASRSDPLANPDEEPRHDVTFTHALEVSSTEVTQGQWNRVVDNGSSPQFFANCGARCPVERVNFYEALRYCNQLSKSDGLELCYTLHDCTGTAGGGCAASEQSCQGDFTCSSVTFTGVDCTGYRLPTEAEWEYMARAGSDVPLPGPELTKNAWFDKNANQTTHAIGTRLPNAWGVRDALGNVAEWTWDAFERYSEAPVTDPTGPLSFTAADVAPRVVRGSSYLSQGSQLREMARMFDGQEGVDPSTRSSQIGFRVVRTIVP